MDYDDEYDYERRSRGRQRPSPPPRMYTDARRSQQFLDPGTDGLYRTRSQGHRPQPQINVYNEVITDNLPTNPRAPSPMGYPQSAYPYYGRRDRLGDELADEFVDMAIDRQRSRTRGRSEAQYYNPRDEFYERELWRKDEEERIRQEYENKRLREDAKRKEDEEARKAERRRIIDDYRQQEIEDEEDRKAEEKRIRDKIALEKIEAKEKEEREWQEFLRKQKDKEDKEKADKAAKEKEIEDELRRRLLANGYTLRQVEAMINEDKVKRRTVTTTTTYNSNTTNALDLWQPNRAPVYAKVHRDFLSVDTLRYYGIPFKYDETDSEYIIVLREMDKYQTEELFAHTKRLRSGKLLIEPAKKQKEYAFFRKRSRSKSRVRKAGIMEYM